MPIEIRLLLGSLALLVITLPTGILLADPVGRWLEVLGKRRKIARARALTPHEWMLDYPTHWNRALRYARKVKGDVPKAIEFYCSDFSASAKNDDLELVAMPAACRWVRSEALDTELGLTKATSLPSQWS